MSLKDINVQHSYTSYGKDNIVTSLLLPALQQAKIYKRSVGFFSSNVLSILIDGISTLVRKNGKIMLICSPRLSAQDIVAIKSGYDNREKIIQNIFSKDYIDSINELSDENLKMLSELIAKEYLDIKIAVTRGAGMYHDKLGIIEDTDGNSIAFYGSSNESFNGYCENYEKIRVSCSWISGDLESVEDEKKGFDNLWSNSNKYVEVFDYTECAKKNLLVITKSRSDKKNNNTQIKLRDYQKDAIDAWVANDYNGFYVMATGTGKTWTAIYSAIELHKKKNAMIVICAPYKHLVKQWNEDVEKAFPEAKIILVSSENPEWETQISQAIIKQKYNPKTKVIIISTIKSFYQKRFISTILKSEQEKLLIVDEAHRFTRYSEKMKVYFKYLLGLSATPFSGKSTEKGKNLMNFFGGQVFNLPIEEALDKGFLVPYYYIPIYVYATEDEERKFEHYTKQIVSCFNANGTCTNSDLLIKSIRARLRIISMAQEKHDSLGSIIEYLKDSDHFVVYCGDGKLFDDNTGAELRHIQSVKNILTDFGFRVSQFTAKENMSERMKLVESFNKGDISGLTAIRCLDEGINIPSIKSALILSSNDDYREFVQRRGRILRTYKGKEYAIIYDVIVLPSVGMDSWASIEFRRFYEYAKLAVNKQNLMEKLSEQLSNYSLTLDDISTFDYDDMEVKSDE